MTFPNGIVCAGAICGAVRSGVQHVVGLRASPATQPRRKGPRPFGLCPGGRPRRCAAWPMSRIGLRDAPSGSPPQGATQAVPFGKVIL